MEPFRISIFSALIIFISSQAFAVEPLGCYVPKRGKYERFKEFVIYHLDGDKVFGEGVISKITVPYDGHEGKWDLSKAKKETLSGELKCHVHPHLGVYSCRSKDDIPWSEKHFARVSRAQEISVNAESGAAGEHTEYHFYLNNKKEVIEETLLGCENSLLPVILGKLKNNAYSHPLYMKSELGLPEDF